MNILFSCAGRRRYLVEYFKQELGERGQIFGTDMSPIAPALEGCDKWFIVPSVYAENYIEALLGICVENKIEVVISLNDLELPILAKNKQRFLDNGVKLVVSNSDVIETCSDKWATVQFASSIGVPVPSSFLNVDDAIKAVEGGVCNLPLIVKPRWGSASFGLQVVNNLEDLNSSFSKCKSQVSNSYLSNFGQSEDTVLIQAFIKGREYGLDIFNDISGRYCGVICKEKLAMRSGETDKAVTVTSDKFTKYAQQIAESLKHEGNLDCDFLEDETGVYLLELNPRFGGGYPFSHEAGGNLVKALLQSLDGRGDEIQVKYDVGRTFAKCDVLVETRKI
jgi:carbamoyl-phosphate synthase large subunit